MNISSIFFYPNILGEIPYVKKGTGEECSAGTEITNEVECKDALRYASSLGITLGNRNTLVEGSWNHVPRQCSYQANGDQAFHFNRNETKNASGFLNGGYRMICKKGKIWIPYVKIVKTNYLNCNLNVNSNLIYSL